MKNKFLSHATAESKNCSNQITQPILSHSLCQTFQKQRCPCRN